MAGTSVHPPIQRRRLMSADVSWVYDVTGQV